MKRSIPVLLLLLPALLAGCASRAPAPDWVSGTAAEYPAALYLLGRGEGPSGEAARERARADLAKGLEVSVAVESEDVQAFRAAAGDGGRYESAARRRITTRSRQLIEGLEIAATWRDPASGRHHALAVLPRLKAAERLRADIERLDETTRLQLGRARGASDLLLKIAAASRALAAQSERAGLQRQLRVVDRTGVGVPPAWSLERLGADLDALLKRLKLAPRVAAGPGDGFEAVLEGALAAAGFLADTGRDPDYVLEARLTLEDLGRREGWYWQRGVLEVRLLETGTGRVRGVRRWPIKASALAPAGAVQRALDAADTVLKEGLRATLIGFAAGTAPG